MMKKIFSLALVLLVSYFAAGCSHEHGGTHNRFTGPSETPTEVKPVQTVVIGITKVSGSTYQVVISGPDLPNTFQQIPSGSWSGALMWLHEWSRNYNYVTDVPFVPGTSDHFTFPYVNSTGCVDFSLRLQPHGSDLTRIPVILNEKVKLPTGYKIVWDEKAAEARVQGPLPS